MRFITSHPEEYPLLLAKKWAHFFATDYWLALSVDPIPNSKGYPNAATLFSRINPWITWGIQLPFMIVLLAGTFGLLIPEARDKRLAFIMKAVPLYWLAAHLIYFANARHRFPIVPLLMLGAAYGWQMRREGWRGWPSWRSALLVVLITVFVAGWIAEYATLRMKTLPLP